MKTSHRHPSSRRKARGLFTLGTALVVAALLVLGYIAFRGVSTLSEYFVIEGLVKKVALAAPATDREVREAFDRQRMIDGVDAVQGSDLVIQRQDGRLVIDFSYDKVVRLAGPVSLLIEYRGSSGGP